MVQREVGERIAASPGNRSYGIPSVILQSLYSVRPLFKVVAGSFTPRPKVDSIVLGFKALETPLVDAGELKHFVALVKNLFQQRRKTIHNTLKSSYLLSVQELRRIHDSTGIDLDRRPEALSTEEFLRVSRTLVGMTSGTQAAEL
jgi:16S rRNA (adenine1518-N6/adenine1519-N6)-dimethyltransferase